MNETDLMAILPNPVRRLFGSVHVTKLIVLRHAGKSGLNPTTTVSITAGILPFPQSLTDTSGLNVSVPAGI